jgi:hypothetical protein
LRLNSTTGVCPLLADPITVPAASPTPALNFYIIQNDGFGTIRKHDGTDKYYLTINHSQSKSGDRHYMQLKLTKDAVSPYTGLTSQQTATASLAFTVPAFGFDNTAMVALVKALTDTLADADVTSLKLLNMQS